ncbi:hypothetical protein Ndes2437B_g00062 [Nannochloris sp. 'desiccata']
MLMSRLRESLHHAALGRALFSTESAFSVKSWTVSQRVAGAASSSTEIINIKPDGKISTFHPNNTQNQQAFSFSPTKWHTLITHQIQSTFLPTGYPHTVSPNYIPYVTWQALHHTAGAANGVLASTFLLYSVGLGAGAIPTAGALSWILKDGLGQLGTLLFGRAMAHNFDLSSRSWYVAASGKLNLAMGLEIATALAPQWFLPLAATANAVKGLAWMAGGSSRSAFNVAFAKDRNIADVTAKATSQTICTSLLGTAAGMAIAASIEQSVGLCFTWYSALAAVHMYTAVESAQVVPLKTLNPSRLKKLAELVVLDSEIGGVNSGGDSSSISSSSRGDISISRKEMESAFLLNKKVPTPAEFAIEDRIFPFSFGKQLTTATNNSKRSENTISSSSKRPLELVVGTSLQKLANTDRVAVAALLPLYKNEKFILVLDKHNKMHLVLHEEAQTVDAVIAVLQATAWNEVRQQHQQREQEWEQNSIGNSLSIETMQREAQAALTMAEKLGPSMVDALKLAGWDVQGVVIEPQRRRATW